jgi:hypothetical protein
MEKSTLFLMKANEKAHDNGWNGKKSLRKASSVGDFYKNKNKFREIYCRLEFSSEN